MSFTGEEVKDESCPSLSLSTDKTNIFVADQTPTPTRLIRNCEEIGLFDDILASDNPFDETFRRAIEQTFDESSTNRVKENEANAEELHTPQVFPHLENESHTTYERRIDEVVEVERPPSTSCVTLDVPCLTETVVNLTQPRPDICVNDILVNVSDANYLQTPKIVHVVQPQAITWQFSSQTSGIEPKKRCIRGNERNKGQKAILPKTQTSPKPEKSKPSTNLLIPPVSSTHHEPSSASLTPTSQLPIKERLKAILNNNQSNRFFEDADAPPKKSAKKPHKSFQSPDDHNERRRAASTRYRCKIRMQQTELRRENEELKAKNKKLMERIKVLEKEIERQRNALQVIPPSLPLPDTCQIRIPPSSINLVINVPSLVLPVNGDPSVIRQP